MQNIYEILKGVGITVPEDKRKSLTSYFLIIIRQSRSITESRQSWKTLKQSVMTLSQSMIQISNREMLISKLYRLN